MSNALTNTLANRPRKAVILAAGFGKRMQPLTDNCPKPLLLVGGKPMIDWILDDLKRVGVTDVIVNTHYLADKIAKHLQTRTDMNIRTSYEKDILETGGGVKNVLELVGNEAFYVLNGDVVWQDFDNHLSALQGLAEMWDSDKMGLLLMVYPKDKLPQDKTLSGDYTLNEMGQLQYQLGAPYVFAGPRIVDPALFAGAPDGVFSFKQLFDKAEDAGKLYGYVHKGAWYHVGTPEELIYVNAVFEQQKRFMRHEYCKL